jgi:hypothetical protein
MKFPFARTLASRTASVVGAVVVTAVVVSGGLGVAQAARLSVPNNSVTSAKIVNGTIQGVDIKDGAIAPADLSVNARPRWAKVDAGPTTTLIRGRGAASATRAALGVYRVSFETPITNCGWTATLNDNDASSTPPGEIGVEREAGTSNNLLIRTFNSAGVQSESSEDNGFTVVVSC